MQNRITTLHTEAIIDLSEPVDVDMEDSGLVLRIMIILENCVQSSDYPAPVDQTRQAVQIVAPDSGSGAVRVIELQYLRCQHQEKQKADDKEDRVQPEPIGSNDEQRQEAEQADAKHR